MSRRYTVSCTKYAMERAREVAGYPRDGEELIGLVSFHEKPAGPFGVPTDAPYLYAVAVAGSTVFSIRDGVRRVLSDIGLDIIEVLGRLNQAKTAMKQTELTEAQRAARRANAAKARAARRSGTDAKN